MNYLNNNILHKFKTSTSSVDRYQKPKTYTDGSGKIEAIPDSPKIEAEDPAKMVRELSGISNAASDTRNTGELTPKLKWVENELRKRGIYCDLLEPFFDSSEAEPYAVASFITNPAKPSVFYVIPTSEYLYVNKSDNEFDRASSAVMGILLASRLKKSAEPVNCVLVFMDGRNQEEGAGQLIQHIQYGNFETKVSVVVELGIFCGSEFRTETTEIIDDSLLEAIAEKAGMICSPADYASDLWTYFRDDFYSASIVDSAPKYELLEELMEEDDLKPFSKDHQIVYASSTGFLTIAGMLLQYTVMRCSYDYHEIPNKDYKH